MPKCPLLSLLIRKQKYRYRSVMILPDNHVWIVVAYTVRLYFGLKRTDWVLYVLHIFGFAITSTFFRESTHCWSEGSGMCKTSVFAL